MKRLSVTFLTVFIMIWVTACSAERPAEPAPVQNAPAPAAEYPAQTSSTPQLPAIEPVPSPEPLHPLSIEWLRERDYPASEIVIEQTLEPGANYERFIASYQTDGLKNFALLTIPFGEPPESGWPVIVFNHGYIQPDLYRTTERYIAYVDAFARSGYLVFRPDYRGHGDSEGLARGGYGNPDYVVDVLNAVSALKELEAADPDRIGMWGHSMGGYITLRAMLADPDIKAGVIWAGVVGSYPDLIERWNPPWLAAHPGAAGWREALYDSYGTPEANPSFWNSISANAYLGELSGPIQLHHGTADVDVPPAFSANLYDQALAAGAQAEYYEYQGDDHNLSNFFTSAMQRSLSFMDTHVRAR